MRTSKIILTADDYGACDFIDQGIIRAIKEGKINSVACFATPFEKGDKGMDDLFNRINTLIELKKNYPFEIGLHFSLTSGRSCQEDVVNNGNSLMVWDSDDECYYLRSAYNYPFKHIDLKELEDEIESQVKTLRNMLGDIPVGSISNHHGLVYMNNTFFDVYSKVAARNQLPIRSPLIWRFAGLPYRNWDYKPMNPLILEGVALRLLDQIKDAPHYKERLALANERNLKHPTCLVDEFYGQAYPENLKGLFKAFELGTFSAEFMFHLGDYNYRKNQGLGSGKAHLLPEPWGIDVGYFNWREEELRILLDTPLPQSPVTASTFGNLIEIDRNYPDWK